MNIQEQASRLLHAISKYIIYYQLS
jgi:hypothetical protein